MSGRFKTLYLPSPIPAHGLSDKAVWNALRGFRASHTVREAVEGLTAIRAWNRQDDDGGRLLWYAGYDRSLEGS
jgi:hypothetical protein